MTGMTMTGMIGTTGNTLTPGTCMKMTGMIGMTGTTTTNTGTTLAMTWTMMEMLTGGDGEYLKSIFAV